MESKSSGSLVGCTNETTTKQFNNKYERKDKIKKSGKDMVLVVNLLHYTTVFISI